ncbi:MAG: [FeFe] hydrogenase, group A [Bacteroidales bacterium]
MLANNTENKKQVIVQSSLGSMFSIFGELELRELIGDNSRKVAIAGRINNPGIYDIPEGASYSELVAIAGGMMNGRNLKAVHFGLPFGGFVTPSHCDIAVDFTHFAENQSRTMIILSDEDCIVQYAKFYIEFVKGKMEEGVLTEYRDVEAEIDRIWRNFDRIAKGKSTSRDLYLLRYLSEQVKLKLHQDHNMIFEILESFYDELVEHIDENLCAAQQCPHLVKLHVTEKCIGCGACKRVCPVDCISGEKKQRHFIHTKICTHCGQCIQACPVNAIVAGDNTVKFLRDLATPKKLVIVQIAPAIRVTIGEAFGFEPGTNVEKRLAAALRMIGVDYVFDTSWAADLTIMEEAKEFRTRLESYMKGDEDVPLPILTSCCPAWVKYIEQNFPELLQAPSTVKSPMQIFSTIAKDIWAKEKGIRRQNITSVAIMPCIAKKYEAARVEFSRGDNFDTDYVITTRELIKILKESGIDLATVNEEEFDNPFGEYSGAGVIFGRTGGVIEAAVRTTIEQMTNSRLDSIVFEQLRGWDGFRVCEVPCGDLTLRIGIAHGLNEAGRMLEKIRNGEEFFHAIEIMACKGGCIGGGGQPKAQKKQEALEKRAEGLNSIDNSMTIRRSHENPHILSIYEKYLDYPGSRKAHELIHTKYYPKIKFNK